MITSVFRKSTPLNFALVVIFLLLFFLVVQLQETSWMSSYFLLCKKVASFCFVAASMFLTDFIAKRNGLTKDSTYTIFFYLLFLLFFPSIFDNINVVIANFFLLLALRRLISLQSLKASKEKIFDASLWIFLASLFHFWSIVFIVLVFISIIFHVARDYRNWILPFIAFFVTGIIFLLFTTVFQMDGLVYIKNSFRVHFALDYFTNNYQNAAMSIFVTVALFFTISMFASLSSRPQILHTSYKKVVASFALGAVIYLISDDKSNDLLLFTFAPLAIMATSHIEVPQEKVRQEIVFYVLIVCSLLTFFCQL